MKKKRNSTSSNYTVEADTWRSEAQILALMGCGFSFEDAWHLSPLDTRRFVAINGAWAIPPEDRISGAVLGTADQLKALMGE